MLGFSLFGAHAATIQFSSPTFTVDEGKPSKRITVTRTGTVTNPATVHYTVSNGTALDGFDYTAVSGELTFSNRTRSRTFTIPILADGLDETNETVNLALSDVTGGDTLGSSSNAVLTITDNDRGGTIRFAKATYNAKESGVVNLVVRRTGGAASNVTVEVRTTLAGSATEGDDFIAFSNLLTFAARQTMQTVQVPILGDQIPESLETIIVELLSPTGGAVLGSPSAAQINLSASGLAISGLAGRVITATSTRGTTIVLTFISDTEFTITGDRTLAGTYSVTLTGPNTLRIVIRSGGRTVTILITFTSEDGGTYRETSLGISSTGTFIFN
jgi:hypothetical protein